MTYNKKAGDYFRNYTHAVILYRDINGGKAPHRISDSLHFFCRLFATGTLQRAPPDVPQPMGVTQARWR